MTANDSFIHGCHQRNPNCPKEVGGDFDFGASPALVRGKDGRDLLIIGQKSGVGYALDPDDGGNIVWQLRLDSGSELGGVEWGFAVDDTQVYFGNAAFLASEPGGVAAVQVATGELVWFTGPGPAVCDGCNSHMRAAVTAIPGVVFVGGSLAGICGVWRNGRPRCGLVVILPGNSSGPSTGKQYRLAPDTG